MVLRTISDSAPFRRECHCLNFGGTHILGGAIPSPAAIPAYLLRSISRCNHIHSNRPSFCQVLQVLFCAGRDPRKKRLGRNAHESLVHKIGGPRLQRRCCCLSRILTAGPRPNWPASKRPRRSRCRPIITAQSLRRCPSIRAGAHRACFVSGPPVSASGQNFTCRVPRRHGQLLPERHDAFHGEFVPQPDSCTATKIKITRS
jgi:hypothetical protein